MATPRAVSTLRGAGWLAAALLTLASCDAGDGYSAERGYGEEGKADRGEAISFERYMDEQVLPYCLGQGVEGEFSGVDGVPIATMTFARDDEQGALVILTGRNEAFLKYCEVVYDLRDLPYSIYLMDHRGQGASGRMLEDRHKGYVEDFDDYVSDIETFVTEVVERRPHDRLLAIAHSMGGAAVTRLAERNQSLFDALVLVTPMHQINTGIVAESLAYNTARAMVAAGLGENYSPGSGPYDPDKPFEKTNLTHSYDRFMATHRLLEEQPELALGGPTLRWVKENYEGTWELREAAGDLLVPVLLFQASDDKVVAAHGQDEVCASARQCEKVVVSEAYHDLFAETDAIRNQVVDRVRAFLVGLLGETAN